MKLLMVLLICVGVGYIAEVYFQNPQRYIVWVVFTFVTFAAYFYLSQITSVAFSLPLTIFLIGVSSIFSYISDEPGMIIFGVYGAMALIILIGGRFISWGWSDWKSPAKFMSMLTTQNRRK